MQFPRWTLGGARTQKRFGRRWTSPLTRLFCRSLKKKIPKCQTLNERSRGQQRTREHSTVKYNKDTEIDLKVGASVLLTEFKLALINWLDARYKKNTDN